jgi:TM2 domain-containing membrane protein YozV
MTIVPFLNKVNQYIFNPLIYLVFAIAFLIFFWGIVQFINSETVDNKRDDGKKKILYGLIGMFIMFSAYGLIRLLLDTFGISGPRYMGF